MNIKRMVGKPTKKAWGFRDADGDGVMNVFDCKPYNKHKQGLRHELAAKASAYVKEKTTEWRQKSAAERDIRKRARAQYYQEKRTQDINEARERAKIESKQRLSDYKKRLKQQSASRSSGGSGFMSAMDAIVGVPPPKKTAPKKRKKRRKKRKTSKKKAMIVYV